ncbi:hypothetical protein LOD99_15141 [Oopsacas minuta]|uniref:Uncharacterized protein n=1 Tax=Oopsacas minuta TaxID=111878 RepID=A0AAV7KCM2_9METZ|nr:hypothetical protein LOD99_15141 [Oopsacas minuta]
MASVVTNKEAYVSYISMGKSPKATVQYLIDGNNISQEEYDTILYKFKSLILSREYYWKKSDLETWENLTFIHILHPYQLPFRERREFHSILDLNLFVKFLFLKVEISLKKLSMIPESIYLTAIFKLPDLDRAFF